MKLYFKQRKIRTMTVLFGLFFMISITSSGQVSGNIKQDFSEIHTYFSAPDTVSYDSVMYYPTYENNAEGIWYGDFNNDNHADILTRHHDEAKISLLLNNGDGSFATASTINSLAGVRNCSTADYNNDGNLDFAFTNAFATGATPTNKLTLYLGNGDGTFQDYDTYTPYGSFTYDLFSGDINNDGYIDIAVSSAGWDGFSVLLNNGNGTFSLGNHFAGSTEAQTIRLIDIDNDNNLDVVLGCGGFGSGYGFDVFRGNGDGTFNPSEVYASPVSATHADILGFSDIDNQNGVDLIVGLFKNDTCLIYKYLNDGTGLFTGSLIVGGYYPIELIDYNSDGHLDIISKFYNTGTNPNEWEGSYVLLGNAEGNYPAPEFIYDKSPIFCQELNNNNLIDFAFTVSDSVGVVLSVLSQPSVIIGDSLVCLGATETYTILPVSGASSYSWSYSGAGVLSETGTSCTLTPTSSGLLSVIANSSYGSSAAQTKSIDVTTIPLQPVIIVGDSIMCSGTTETYTISSVNGATSYTWTYSGEGTFSVTGTCCTLTPISSGILSVTADNFCGSSTACTKSIDVTSIPSQPEMIVGMTVVCSGTSEIYSISAVSGATMYTWTYSGEGTPSGTGTSCTLIPTSSGTLSVTADNFCGSSDAQTANLTIITVPLQPDTISGNTTVCQGGNSETYTVPSLSNATSYVWTLPSGATGSSITNSITVNFGLTSISGDITVSGLNSCGEGEFSALPITVNLKPTTPSITLNGLVLESDSPNGNQWYDQNGLITGASNPSYTVLDDGAYYVIVSLLGCSSNPSNTIYVTVTGEELTESNSSLKVYPNPVSKELILEIEGNNEQLKFYILNTLGQIVFKGNITEKTIVQTIDFAPGIYIVKLENGKTFEFKKVIKKMP